MKRKGFRLQGGVMSLQSSERARLGPDLVGRRRGLGEEVKVREGWESGEGEVMLIS